MGNCFSSLTHTTTTDKKKGVTIAETGIHRETETDPTRTQTQTETQTQRRDASSIFPQSRSIAAVKGVSSPSATSISADCVGGGGGGGGTPLQDFSYADLRTATRNFRPDSLIGEGGFGRVFKGHIDPNTFAPSRPGHGILVAVKKLTLEGDQGHNEWLAEVRYLGELHHPNLVKLIGFCAEEEHRLLVYEFMQRGSLDNHLFRKGNTFEALSWAMRMKIAVHAARGLFYLHTCERPIIYRDFKSANILLDSEFNAKLSDFGLAKDGPTGDNTHVTTRVMGTYGYAAPEYVATGRLTSKSDVYGYGVVLLEILTGRRAMDKTKPYGEQNLVEWATPFLNNKHKVLRIIDQKLDGQYSLKGAKRVTSLAVHCLNEDAKVRPNMKQVLDFIEPLYSSGAHSSPYTASPYRPPVSFPLP